MSSFCCKLNSIVIVFLCLVGQIKADLLRTTTKKDHDPTIVDAAPMLDPTLRKNVISFQASSKKSPSSTRNLGGNLEATSIVEIPNDVMLGEYLRVYNVWVDVDITHPSIGSLEIKLTKKESGRSLTIFGDGSWNNRKYPCGRKKKNQNILNVTFDDTAVDSIPWYPKDCPDLSLGETFKPTILSKNGTTTNPSLTETFKGEFLFGTWILTVTDESNCPGSQPCGTMPIFNSDFSLSAELTVCSYDACGRNNQKYKVCHVPKDPAKSPITLCLNMDQMRAHMGSHDADYCGPCRS